MEQRVQEYLEKTHSAAMITLHRDGRPHAVRVGVALVDGKLWSSGTQDRVRTAHVRRDPRATLFVYDAKDPGGFSYLGLETNVSLIEGPEVGEKSLHLFQVMQGQPPGDTILWYGKPLPHDEFLQAMSQEKRLIYEFEITKSYGMF